ncbi:MAG: hypothetical protein HQL22_07965 [Candidatus Omnitrophica bacterium]|nr:hypothetical protein [Candidatus Omnitrophota bacterium]
MKLPDKLGYKIYFLIFSWLALGELTSLLAPKSDAFIYYNTLRTFYPPAALHYYIAILRATITLAALIPLFNVAFNRKMNWGWFFKPLLIVRVVADVTGHNYEWQFIRSLAHGGFLLPLAAVGVWIGVNYLSYKTHYICAFNLQPETKK